MTVSPVVFICVDPTCNGIIEEPKMHDTAACLKKNTLVQFQLGSLEVDPRDPLLVMS